ncbi:hypothetical protein L195_g056986 [Trifolium pratense]|uniref:Uncharacterized protein n=1 Tax=Trifolium pratense TaxID=57577 RepID=A0A2K3KUG2_TRIPR|nr:hypothetical protein L195_g056986 [Trifolium pratense]
MELLDTSEPRRTVEKGGGVKENGGEIDELNEGEGRRGLSLRLGIRRRGLWFHICDSVEDLRFGGGFAILGNLGER